MVLAGFWGANLPHRRHVCTCLFAPPSVIPSDYPTARTRATKDTNHRNRTLRFSPLQTPTNAAAENLPMTATSLHPPPLAHATMDLPVYPDITSSYGINLDTKRSVNVRGFLYWCIRSDLSYLYHCLATIAHKINAYRAKHEAPCTEKITAHSYGTGLNQTQFDFRTSQPPQCLTAKFRPTCMQHLRGYHTPDETNSRLMNEQYTVRRSHLEINS